MTETQTDALLSGIWDEAITEITLSQTLFSYMFNELFESAFGSYEAAAKKLSKAQIGYTKQIYSTSKITMLTKLKTKMRVNGEWVKNMRETY